MNMWKRIITVVVVSGILGIGILQTVFAQEATPTTDPNATPTPSTDSTSQQISDLQNKISDLEHKISGLQTQEKTLSSQISVMDNQINLTQYKMQSTQQQINVLTANIGVATKKVTTLEGSLDGITKVLLSHIVASYENGSIQPVQILMTSDNVSDFLKRASYLHIVEEHDRKLVYTTQQARNDYQNQKSIFEDEKAKVEALKKQLEDYASQLNQEKGDKQKLLAETQGSETNYQKLLSQAQAQLSGFTHFATSQGGASLLSGQTVCDDWGCYYNQRDSQWGGIALNNSQYSIAEAGCLMTSVAMVMSHYGHHVTPLDINSNPNNFASYYRAYLLYTVSAGGATSQRSGSTIDANLSNGNPVIVGVSYDGGPIADHFVVLKSGSGGSYVMDDPFTPNGHDIPFTSKYSLGSIVEIDKVTML